MNKIKHCSFDLWLTIINSNPKFKEFLIQFWANKLNRTQNFSKIILRNMKDYFVKRDEITGFHTEFIEQLHFLYSQSGYTNLHKGDYEDIAERVYPEIEEAFLNNLPVLYDNDTKFVLKTLKEDKITTNILSNTGIIEGNTLNKALEELGINEYFTFKIYSDECGLAKPNREIFKEVWKNKNTPTSSDKILHIGDNPIADGGCIELGIQFLQINSNKNTIKEVLEYV